MRWTRLFIRLNKRLQTAASGRADLNQSLPCRACCCTAAVRPVRDPNISPETEYRHREEELGRLIREMHPKHAITYVTGRYEPERFYETVRGLEQIPEGGERCFACYRLRMEEAASLAAQGGYDYFTTTLSISPLKNADKINEIGLDLEKKYGVKHLPSDFKKKDGYQRSIVLSKEHGLYRQDYCGCVFSKAEREREKRIRSRMESD